MHFLYFIVFHHLQKFRIGDLFRRHLRLPAAEHTHEKERDQRDQKKHQDHLPIVVFLLVGVIVIIPIIIVR